MNGVLVPVVFTPNRAPGFQTWPTTQALRELYFAIAGANIRLLPSLLEVIYV